MLLFVGVLYAQAQQRRVQHKPYIDLRPLHFGIVVGTHLQDIEFENVGLQTIVDEEGNVIPEYIVELFPHAAKGTAAEGAQLLFERVPGRFQCPDCGYEGRVDRREARCPDCGGIALKMTAGREFFVESLKVE